MNTAQIYQQITVRILAEMEKGIIPWQRPWTSSTGAISHISGRPYSLLPADLQQLHDRLMRKKNAAEREKEIEKHREDTDKFLKYYMKFLGICIEVGDITIRPLQNFEEFYDEGKAMHHCVAMYFGRAGSLILSARQGDKRLATIELDTKKFEVQQCRCVNNGHPERYDEIVSILNDHRKDFIKANRKRVA